MATIRVANQSQLDTALKNVKSGDTVVMASGTYSSLFVKDKSFASTVKFVAESSTNPPVVNELRTYNATNVSFEGLKVARAINPAVDKDWSYLSRIHNSNQITLNNVTFTSWGSDAKYTGAGLWVRDSSNIVVQNSDFSKFAVGMNAQSVSNIQVLNNKFHDLRIDGSEFTDIHNSKIDGNYYYDFNQADYTYHPDAIQIWTAGTNKGSTDVLIQNNVVMQGTGYGSQGIFVQDEVGGIPHERVTIRNNLVYNNSKLANGIMVNGGKDIVIEGNTVLSPTSDNANTWLRVQNVSGARVSNNVADTLFEKTVSNVAYSGNVFLSSQKSAIANYPGLNLGASATIKSLISAGVGYQLPVNFNSSFYGVAGGSGTSTLGQLAPSTSTSTVSSMAATSTTVVAPVTTPTTASTTTAASSSTSTSGLAFGTFNFASLSDQLTPIASAAATPVAAASASALPTATNTSSVATLTAAATSNKATKASIPLISVGTTPQVPVSAANLGYAGLSKLFSPVSTNLMLAAKQM